VLTSCMASTDPYCCCCCCCCCCCRPCGMRMVTGWMWNPSPASCWTSCCAGP